MATRVMPVERRRAQRLPAQVPCSITDVGGAFSAQTENLSASGLYCTLDHFIAPMSKLEIALELPNGPRPIHMRCHGVVVRTQPVVATIGRGRYQIAVLFTEVTERDRRAIARFVQRRLSSKTPG